ncbi:MAG: rRNA pseudouridine synthase [Saprospiraceae bacterium]|nr:rRNA pseudouridine synthase [Saprospiraceae bacterium]
MESIPVLRLNKYIAHCGVCNRRKAIEIIKSGEIKVNEEVETNPFYELKEHDNVSYKGKQIVIEEKKVYLLLNKPKNMPLIHSTEMTKPDVMALIKKKTDVTVFPIDQLLESSAGLMVLTNDTQVLEKFNSPDHKCKKVYQVSLQQEISTSDMQKMKDGVELNGKTVKVVGIDHIRDLGHDALGIEIHNGDDHIINEVFKLLGYQVTKLDRTYFAGLTKKDLTRGWSRFLTEKEVIFLKHFS